MKCTIRSSVRRCVWRKSPRIASSDSGKGYSGSSSSRRDRQTSVGERSSTHSLRRSAEYGWKACAMYAKLASFPIRFASAKRSLFSESSQITLPRQPSPRCWPSSSSGSLTNSPSLAISCSLCTVVSMALALWQIFTTQKPFSKMHVAISLPKVAAPVLGAIRTSKPPPPGSPDLLVAPAGRTFFGSKYAATPLTKHTWNLLRSPPA
mmetsp:Transcript_109638/g.309940  ORF Transcript_109638/g.309940 Transcript_109638/m.309940 type:complete len:207 (-) Transcript_109638:141-761(-)